MSEWGKDVRAFVIAMWKHWGWWVTTILGSTVGTIYQARGGMIPNWLLWVIALSGIVVAAFLAHRDECRKTESANKKIRELENKFETIQNRKRIKDALANYLGKLEYRILEITKMDALSYVRTIENGQIDRESKMLAEEIAAFLRTEIGDTESALFVSITGFTFSNKNFHPVLEKAELLKQNSIDLYRHYAKQLKEIIQTQK